MKTTEQIFNVILKSSMFSLDGSYINLPEIVIELCQSIKKEEDTDWCLGDGDETSLGDFIIGAYWAFSQWHAGQESIEYAAMCALGGIYTPNMSCEPNADDSEWFAFDACNTWFSGRSSAVKLSEADAEIARMIERLRGLPHHDGIIDDSIIPEQFRPPQSESEWDGHETCVYDDGSKCIRVSRSVANDVNKSFMLYESITELTDETAAHASLSFDSTAAYAIYCAILKLYPEFKKQHEINGNIH